jgi:hypothetical protein
MNFKYRWKNGAPPSRDQAAHSDQLLDESQFESKHDQALAEEMARKQLNVPVRTQDADRSILPHGDGSQADVSDP